MESYEVSFLELIEQHRNGIIRDGSYYITDEDEDISVYLEKDSFTISDYEHSNDFFSHVTIYDKYKFLVGISDLNEHVRDWYKERIKDKED